MRGRGSSGRIRGGRRRPVRALRRRGVERDRIEVGLGLLEMGLSGDPLCVGTRHERTDGQLREGDCRNGGLRGQFGGVGESREQDHRARIEETRDDVAQSQFGIHHRVEIGTERWPGRPAGRRRHRWSNSAASNGGRPTVEARPPAVRLGSRRGARRRAHDQRRRLRDCEGHESSRLAHGHCVTRETSWGQHSALRAAGPSGARFSRCLTSPSLQGGSGMERIQSISLFPSIPPSALGEFRSRRGGAAQPSPTRSQGRCSTSGSSTRDETQCIVHETFVDSDAVLAHIGNAAELGPGAWPSWAAGCGSRSSVTRRRPCVRHSLLGVRPSSSSPKEDARDHIVGRPRWPRLTPCGEDGVMPTTTARRLQ